MTKLNTNPLETPLKVRLIGRFITIKSIVHLTNTAMLENQDRVLFSLLAVSWGLANVMRHKTNVLRKGDEINIICS